MTNKKDRVPRRTAVLYLTATCNLKCRYCYIDKSPSLVDIDNILEETYQDENYFFDLFNEIFSEDKDVLTRIEFWGGEPSYGLKRVYKLTRQIIENYPNVNNIMMSTNFTTKTVIDDIFNYLKVLSEYPDRHFNFDLQLSLDGPEEITDFNRGKNVTKLFTNNFIKFVKEMDERFKDIHNVTLNSHFKPTLAQENIALLQTKEKVIEYYKFFEYFEDLVLENVKTAPYILQLATPNTATPAPVTIEGGKNFANLCKIIEDIQNNFIDSGLKYDRILMPFVTGTFTCPDYSLCNGCGTCGAGSEVIGLLPYDYISTCHNGFVELLTSYKDYENKNAKTVDRAIDFRIFITNNAKNFIIYPKDELEIYTEQMNLFNCDEKFQATELASLITLYARNGQIDKKYLEPKFAIQAAHFIQRSTSSCMRDNLGVTGTKFLFQTGFIKLFLNGAKEYIERSNDRFRERIE